MDLQTYVLVQVRFVSCMCQLWIKKDLIEREMAFYLFDEYVHGLMLFRFAAGALT